MRIALLKIGARVAENLDGIATGEVLSIYNILKKADPTNDVCVFTQILKKDVNQNIKVKDIEAYFDDIKNYDVMVVVNGNAAFFGGKEMISDCMTYKAMQQFPNKIFYFLCDPAITLKNIDVRKKTWADKYVHDNYLTFNGKVTYVCQAFDLDAVKKLVRPSDVTAENYVRFGFEKFPLFSAENKQLPVNDNPDYDISYGGTFRSGRREADMKKYFFGHATDISIEVFGKIEEENFENLDPNIRRPIFNGKVPYAEFNSKMNKALSTIVIGDPLYIKTEDIAQRIYESILANCVTFIDSNYDKKKHVYSNPELQEFCYVSSVEELDEKIRKLKNDSDFRHHILELQFEDVKLDIEQYKKDMMNILRS